MGRVIGIGVGPGDPELLTVKAVNAIKSADVIIAPRTEKKEGSVALDIARGYIGETTQVIYQIYPMIMGFEKDTGAWDDNAGQIIELVQTGKQVVFLTLGDPMFYSTYIYIFNRLEKAGIAVETVPGIPAFCAIASQLGRSSVEGDDILSIIPATAPEEKIRQALAACDSAVIMKVSKNLDRIAEMLADTNMLEDSVLVSRCGLPDQEVIENIATEKHRRLNYLSTILAKGNI
ncbi:MAG: precorrin-2 C(20)-methyltransferase [Anaerovibrio sp.]|uniref:precorrin-2 C(20)-methyltransferase n=1 Tax=Anaerovibrio sp. TaxID=1872532 RepID=UPI0025F236DB|nr:precorrin-2 C(20)-methyltransferase [Anaerovibrio sp.]MCR5176975.1 precorrin-2 C(20)-methyltransferase [Anaerovibrio sp.]